MWCPCLGALSARVAELLCAASGSTRLDRRQALTGMAAAFSAAMAGCSPAVSAAQRDAAAALLRERVSVDLHSHPGLTRGLSRAGMDTHIERITRGKLTASLWSVVSDGPVLGISREGRISARREPAPGELHAWTYQSLDTVKARIAAGRLALIDRRPDLDVARAQGRPGAILAAEGGDFLEGRLERVREAHARGLRSIQLVHYRVNELGDIQTEPPHHGGLTPFGRAVIREMNRLGMVVDLAHATEAAVKAAVDVSSQPMIISHTVVNVPGMARAVTREHARLVTRGGGLVGVFPVSTGGPGFRGFIDQISRMVDAVGIDHAAIGTDMDGIPAQFVSFDDYSEWPSVAEALLTRGYGREDVAKVLGGNFLRVFEEVAAR